MTKEGLRLTFVGVVAGILGIAANWDGPLVVGGSILAVALVALVFTVGSGTGAVTHCPTTIECERLSSTTIDVDITTTRRIGIYAEVATDAEPRRLYRLERTSRSARLRLPVDTRRRFAGNIGPIRIVRRDPFGVARRVIASTPTIEVIVTPRIIDNPAPHLRRDSDDGVRESTTQSATTTVTETVREYVAGDEPRRIHWRSSARLGQLMVRRETSTPTADVLVVLDRATTTWNTAPSFGNDNSADNFECAVEAVAALINGLLPSGRTITLLCGDEGTTVVDRTAERAFLRTLAAVGLSDSTTLSGRDFIRATRQLRGTHLIVVTRGTENRRLVLAASPRATIIEPNLPESTK